MDPLHTEYQDTEYVMGEFDESVAELTNPDKKANAVRHIGAVPAMLVTNFLTNGVPLDRSTQGTLKTFGPRLQELAQGLPGTKTEFTRAVSEFRQAVDTVLKKGELGRSATGARRRKSRKTRKNKKRMTRRR